MFNIYGLMLTVYYLSLPLTGYAAYRLSYAAVVKYRLERYVIYAPWVVLRDDRGVVVLDAEKDSLEREIEELRNSVIRGDCVEVMEELPENSAHAVVTDPPYNFGGGGSNGGFMGKDWDNIGEPKQYQKWCENWSEEALRVLKPGAYLLSFGGPKTEHRLKTGLEDAGFEIKDTVMWLYGQGFPKSHDISKAIQKEIQEVEPERVKKAEGVGFMNPDDDGWHKTKNQEIMPELEGVAKKWNGWGTALKPAVEPICLAQKPRENTYAENVLKHGCGGLNIDACQIGDEKIESGRGGRKSNSGFCTPDSQNQKSFSEGRWPANVILDPQSSAMLDEQSGVSKSTGCAGEKSGKTGQRTYGNYKGDTVGESAGGYGDSGGASRFFYSAKAHPSERDAGVEDLYWRKGDGLERICRAEWEQLEKRERARGNPVSTLKPISLMRYLIRLVTPENGVVLDPFAGSGTTGCAAAVESFNYIMIEKREPFATIISPRRIEYWSNPRHWGKLKDHNALPSRDKHDAEGEIPRAEEEPESEEQTQLSEYSKGVENSEEVTA